MDSTKLPNLTEAAPDLYAALYYCETIMMIVEPRSHKAEYLAGLAQARAALAKARGELTDNRPIEENYADGSGDRAPAERP